MIGATVRMGLFQLASLVRNKIQVPLLQFADDVLFVGEWSHSNISNLLKLLKCFEEASGLKINLHKSCLIGVGVPTIVVERLARKFCCKVDCTPFTYLGLPVGDNMRKKLVWAQVEQKCINRMGSWKCQLLSMAGHLTIVRLVLVYGWLLMH